jgi:phage gp36-like protein
MSAVIIDDTELNEYVGVSSLVDVYANASEPNRQNAILKATDMIRQAALNDYTSDSFEALSLSSSPQEMKFKACQLAMGILTAGAAARPDSITNGWNEALKYLSILASGKTHYSQLTKTSTSTGSSAFSYQNPTRKFDRDSNDYFNDPTRS